LIILLCDFKVALSLEINDGKNNTYVKVHTKIGLYGLAHLFGKWTKEEKLSKLLSKPFNMNLDVTNVEKFLLEKLKKSLFYWSITRLFIGRQGCHSE
jgi:hypothetical protein